MVGGGEGMMEAEGEKGEMATTEMGRWPQRRIEDEGWRRRSRGGRGEDGKRRVGGDRFWTSVFP